MNPVTPMREPCHPEVLRGVRLVYRYFASVQVEPQGPADSVILTPPMRLAGPFGVPQGDCFWTLQFSRPPSASTPQLSFHHGRLLC